VVCDDATMVDWVVDLDGVVWRGRAPVPGSAEALSQRIALGERVVFCTNNSSERGSDKAATLVRHGLPDGVEVVTSADAVATLVEPGATVMCLGGPGLMEALASTGADVVHAADPVVVEPEVPLDGFDVVVVGLARDVDYGQLDRAAAAVRAGAVLLASNDDATFPGEDRLHPGCGALVAAVETAAGRRAVVAGKPNDPMAQLLRRQLPGGAVVVGDRTDTDGRLAAALGWPFALVLSGVTTAADLPPDVPTAVVAADLRSCIDSLATWLPDASGHVDGDR
jgi:glycerol 3-phosphatase-2